MKLDPVFHQFFKSASALRLTDDEKYAMRTALTARMALRLTSIERREGRKALKAYMRDHPLPASSPQWLDVLHSLIFSRAPAFAMSALIVVAGSGIAVASAAEGALPGDAFYTIKVDVLEPLRGRLLRTPEERMAWKVRKVERRLAEARSLMQGGSFTESRRGLIEGSITREVHALQEAEQGIDEDTAIASQQVLEETMENSVAEDLDADSEHPQWSHLKTFVRARRSDVHEMVRERMQTAYGSAENVAPNFGSVPMPAAAEVSELPAPAVKPLPVPDSEESPEESPVLMMQAKEKPAIEKSRMSKGNDESPASLSNKEQDLRETHEQEKGNGEAMERLKEKREHIEKQLRGFREDRGLLR
jgi:hypothetical protein